MTIADKLLQVNQVKQDIKTAIEAKGIPLTNVAFTEYANKILDISGGTELPPIGYDEIDLLGWAYYVFSQSGTLEELPDAWSKMKQAGEVLYEIPVTLVAPNQDMAGMTVDIFAGTDGTLEQLYNDCVNGVIGTDKDLISKVEFEESGWNQQATFSYYLGDVSSSVGFPVPAFSFGLDPAESSGLSLTSVFNGFVIADLSFLGNDLGVSMIKMNVGTYMHGIIKQTLYTGFGKNVINYGIADKIGLVDRFFDWSGYTIGETLVIPKTQTRIEAGEFSGWSSNKPIILHENITHIDYNIDFPGAFEDWPNVPYVEIHATTPPSLGAEPTLADLWAFNNQNNAPIYVPDESVNAYKTATNWSYYADRIFSINDK